MPQKPDEPDLPDDPSGDLPDDPITAGPGATGGAQPQSAAPAGGKDDLGLPDDPITAHGRTAGRGNRTPFQPPPLSPEQKGAQARTEQYLQKNEPPGFVQGAVGAAVEDAKSLLQTGGQGAAALASLAGGNAMPLLTMGWGTVKGMAQGNIDDLKKARQAYQDQKAAIQRGDSKAAMMYGAQMAGHITTGLTPIYGPGVSDIAEDIGRGNYGRASVHAAELFGGELLGMGKPARLLPKSRLSPVQAGRYAEAETRAAQAGYQGQMISRGEESGIPALQKGEQTMRHVPGAAGPAERFYTPREAELERQARESVAKVSPKTSAQAAPADVGEDVYGEAGRSIRSTKRAADKVYTDIRASTPQQTLRIGTKEVVDPDGVVTYQPIYGTYEAPVPLKPFRAKLRPLYSEFRSQFKDLTEAERQANPGYASLHRIMTDIDPLTDKLRTYMSAMDLDKELGAIKGQLRDRRFSNFLFSPSGRVQLRVINEGEGLLGQALDRAKPGLSQKLQQGKALVRKYSTEDRLLTRIVGKPENVAPIKLYEAMTAAKDRKIGAVTQLAKLAPNTSKAVWRTYLEGMLQDASKDVGRIKGGSGAGLVDRWDKLGPKTKQIAFGPQLSKELDTAFHNIKNLMPAEGSPTAWRIPIIGMSTEVASALGSLLMGHPASAAAIAGNVAAQAIGFNILARVMFRSGGGAAVANLLRAIRVGGPALRVATQAFEARVADAQQERRQEQASSAPPATTPAAAPQTRQMTPQESAAISGRVEGAINADRARMRARAAPEATSPAASPTARTGPRAAPQAGLAPGASPVAPSERGVPYESSEGGPRRNIPMRPAPGAAPAPPAAGTTAIPDQPRVGAGVRRWSQDFQAIGRQQGVPPGLLAVVAQLESSGRPNVVGSSGEKGLMQLMPATARSLGVDPLNPQESIRGAATLLRRLMGKYNGEVWKVLAAYNEGETAFDRRQRREAGRGSLPPGTQRYVQQGLAMLRGGGQEEAALTSSR